MRAMVAEALRERGFVVCTVADGTNLLAATEVGPSGEPFDLVVSDIRMPGCSGLVFLEKLRRAGRTTPVVLMTAFGDEETRDRVISLGAFLLEKPFDMRSLAVTVRRVLSAPRR
jgi:DNA-binding response OmpR family regulator